MTDGEVPFNTKELKEYVMDSFKNHGHMPSRVEKDILGYIDEVINDYFDNKVILPKDCKVKVNCSHCSGSGHHTYNYDGETIERKCKKCNGLGYFISHCR